MVHVLDGNREAVALGNCRFIVLSGKAWITRKGDPEDFILDEGQEMELPGRGWIAQGLRPGKALRYQASDIRELSAGARSSSVFDAVVSKRYPAIDRDRVLPCIDIDARG